MSSSEKAKTPATFEERNPFDISRHSGPEVASEIAKRMAAWKTARARVYAAPTTIPNPDTKQPPIAAPVQPARAPKAAAQPASSARDAASPSPRAPYFASASATRRAMPPAPSLKRPIGDQRAPAPAAPTAQVPEQAPPREYTPPIDAAPALDAAPAVNAPVAAAAVADSTPIEDSPFAAAAMEASTGPNAAIAAADPEPGRMGDKERFRAEARAIRARWIAAHDLDSFVAAETATAAGVEAAAHGDAPVDEMRAPAHGLNEEQAQRVDPEEDTALEAAGDDDATPAQIRTPAETVSHTEPEAPATENVAHEPSEEMSDPQTSAALGDLAGRGAAISVAAREEIDGRKEPTFDGSEIAEPRATYEEVRAPETGVEPDDADIRIAALDAMAGRKEPTFGEPIRPVVSSDERTAEPAATENQAAVELPRLDTGPLDRAAEGGEPAPAIAPKPAASIAVPRIKMRPIETRIEARRIDMLRAEPELSAGRPAFADDPSEDWDIPPAFAAKPARARRGTGWAIGLGSVLLIAGVTAPAAIWQQGRQDRDRVATITPAPAPQPAAPASATAESPSTSTAVTATLPAPPQQDVAGDAPVAKSAEEDFASVLQDIGDGVEVQPAPVMTPPPPAETLTSGNPAPADTLMVARPFVPESGEGPFLRAPAGAAGVPPVGAKPALIVQLKPKLAATAAQSTASKPKPAARQPKPFFQQSPDQMFDTLIETLSNGEPANPATKPQSPSTRR